MALQGAKNKLSAQAVGCIFCEVEFRSLYENQPLFWDISGYLMSHRYHFLKSGEPENKRDGCPLLGGCYLCRMINCGSALPQNTPQANL